MVNAIIIKGNQVEILIVNIGCYLVFFHSRNEKINEMKNMPLCPNLQTQLIDSKNQCQ